MRRIDISSYPIESVDGRSPDEKLKSFLANAQVAVIKRRSVEKLAISPEYFDATALDELIKPDAQMETTVDYNVRDSIIEILFHPDLQLGARAVLDRDAFARKIKDWPDNDLLLEEEEYKKVVAALEVLRGLARRDVEFIKRVLNAPQVEVQPKTEPTKSEPTKI